MADGGDNSEHWGNQPDNVRRQVVFAVRTVVDVPAGWTEDEVRRYVEKEVCRRDLIMTLAEEIDFDSQERQAGRRPVNTELCDVCMLSTVKLVPVEDEVESEWLDNLGFETEDDDEEEGD